ncbi:hypothetical protein NKR19_g5980 [Coniochaeta hoffmannii]|uniref:Uncharacterized protein n=1 Tax=Coniochaeta hoffmannii TaxID=91930 RepID=A0AA38VR92_9PEZI|nr:hypothetical protein NKR19_g5980 [Coniochaeta hoffmannii]
MYHIGGKCRRGGARQKTKPRKTYNTRDSPVVTHPSTSLAIVCLSMGERTGSRVLRHLWSPCGSSAATTEVAKDFAMLCMASDGGMGC